MQNILWILICFFVCGHEVQSSMYGPHPEYYEFPGERIWSWMCCGCCDEPGETASAPIIQDQFTQEVTLQNNNALFFLGLGPTSRFKYETLVDYQEVIKRFANKANEYFLNMGPHHVVQLNKVDLLDDDSRRLFKGYLQEIDKNKSDNLEFYKKSLKSSVNAIFHLFKETKGQRDIRVINNFVDAFQQTVECYFESKQDQVIKK